MEKGQSEPFKGLRRLWISERAEHLRQAYAAAGRTNVATPPMPPFFRLTYLLTYFFLIYNIKMVLSFMSYCLLVLYIPMLSQKFIMSFDSIKNRRKANSQGQGGV